MKELLNKKKVEIIFIAGVHGVGKTHYCNSLKDNEIKSYSASELIRKYKKITEKMVKNIEENQNILLKAISYLQEEKIYLDGHFCLLNTKKEIVQIPMQIFKKLGIKEIFILYSDVKSIADRLKKRDEIEYSYSLINELQKSEIIYGKEVARQLNVPLRFIKV